MLESTGDNRSWDVLLIGGASGTGKTSVSYPLARRFGVAITEIDDLHIVAEQLTTPEQQPVLHYWRTHPEALQLPPEEILEYHISVCRVMAPAIRAVIANHIETQMPVVLEGDWVLPEFLGDATIGEVRGVFLYEPDEGVILRNLAAREPDAGVQVKRAHVGWLLGQWLKAECERLGIAALPARPWDSLIDRIVDAVS